MKLLRSIAAAFAMYSKFPVPQVEWEAGTLALALCCFPLVGVAIGLVLFAWLWLAAYLGFGTILTAALALLLPVGLSGGIHLDGLCDTADALGSHQSKERKLEILKDSHIGAFGVMTCALYLLLFFAAWCQILPMDRRTMRIAALVPVLSRGCSGLMAVTMPNARGTGLLAAFTQSVRLTGVRVILTAWILLSGAAMIIICPLAGIPAVCAAMLVVLYFRIMCRRQFGGITGDLAGFFLQLCELACILALAVFPGVWEVLLQWF